MPITIGSNIASLVAQRRLASSSSKLSQLFERLGSGQRINRASDDAAGLAISESLNVKSRVFQRAKLNVNDGVSVLNTADGALGQMSSLLERMAQLAEQAANGSLTFSQRKSLQQEYAALDQEIRRITESTTFNGMHLLKGDYSQASHSQLVQGVDALVIGATPSYVDVSENGRFVVYTAPFSDANTKVVFDTQTGEQRSIDMGAARTLLGVSNTGDFYLANGTSSIERYSYSDNNVSTIFTAADSGAFMTDSFSVSADGSTIAFATDTHYENGASQDSGSRVVGNYKVSVYNIENDQVSQVDHSLGAFGIKTDLSGDGRHLAWSYLLGSMERGDVNGTSIDNVETLTTNSVTFFQINNSGAITFSSNEDIGGLNPGLQSNIFTIDSSGNASKLTDFQGVTFDQISISSDGTMVSFITNEDPWGLNTTGGFQAYRMDLTLGTYEQITQLSDNTFGSPTTEAVAISANGSTVITAQSGAQTISITRPDEGSLNLDFEAGFGEIGNIMTALESVRSSILSLGTTEISTAGAARLALDQVRDDLESISSVRGILGAGLSRLESSHRLLSSQQDETIAARSRIISADIGADSAELVRQQILQQASTAILAQANQQPQLAFRLLANA